MIRKISGKYKNEIIKYLMEEPYYSTYILGDIEFYGIESKEVSLYTNDSISNIRFVLMSFLDDYVLYSINCDFNVDEVTEFILKKENKNNYCISGKGDAIDKLYSKMPNTTLRATTLARYEGEYLNTKNEPNLKELSINDSSKLLKLYLSIDEFKDKYKSYNNERMKNVFLGGHVFGLFSEFGQLIASASSTAESSISAMITNVCVHPQYRNKKYSTLVLRKLISTLQGLNISNICLYYDNPVAANIYRKFGFIEKGLYKTLRNKSSV